MEQSVSILSHTCPGAQCVVVGGSGTRGCCGTRVRGPVKVISLVLGPAAQACLKGAGHAGCGQSMQQLHVNAGQCQHWSTAQRWVTTQSCLEGYKVWGQRMSTWSTAQRWVTTQSCLECYNVWGQWTQQLHVNTGQQHRGEWPHKAVLKAIKSEDNECQHWSTAQRWATTQSCLEGYNVHGQWTSTLVNSTERWTPWRVQVSNHTKLSWRPQWLRMVTVTVIYQHQSPAWGGHQDEYRATATHGCLKGHNDCEEWSYTNRSALINSTVTGGYRGTTP